MISKILRLMGYLHGLLGSSSLDEVYRADFEKELIDKAGSPPDLSRYPGGEYVDKELEGDWQKWRRAREQSDLSI